MVQMKRALERGGCEAEPPLLEEQLPLQGERVAVLGGTPLQELLEAFFHGPQLRTGAVTLVLDEQSDEGEGGGAVACR